MSLTKTCFILLIGLAMSHCTSKPELNDSEVSQIEVRVSEIDQMFASVKKKSEDFAIETLKIYENEKSILKMVKKDKYTTAPSGVYYKPFKEDESDGYLAAQNGTNPEARKILWMTEALEPTLRKLTKDNANIVQAYYNNKHSVNRIYPPINVLAQYEPRMDIPTFNFYYLADLQHNPGKGGTWVDEPYVDPAGRGWMISSIAPVYYKNELAGVVGLDITLEQLTDLISPSNSIHLMLVHNNGLVISVSERLAQLLELPPLSKHRYNETIKADHFRPDDFNVLKNKNLKIRNFAESLIKKDKIEIVFNEKVVATSFRLKELPWKLIAFKEQN